jgi:putative nucleotidyltransferase with HDIG domain
MFMPLEPAAGRPAPNGPGERFVVDGAEQMDVTIVRRYERHRSAQESRRWRDSLEADMRSRFARLADTISFLRVDSDDTLDSMLAMLTAGDREAYAHAYRVAALSTSMARVLGVPEQRLSVIERGALLHDLGKLAMPEAILRKPAPLSPEEQTLVRMHPQLGSEMIAHIPYLSEAATVVRDAQERPDGRGYPRGVQGSSLPLEPRIVTVADAYDTMTRQRVFRDALSPCEAILELERCSGTQFDQRAVGALMRVLAVR